MGWQKLATKVIYDNPWMTVREDRVINPSGGRNDYGYVHFKNRAVAIVPLDDHGNTWLVGQQRYTLGKYLWELPMGGAPLNEEPLNAAKRELREETGLSASNWTHLMALHISKSITDEEGHVFVARNLQEGETEFDDTEDLTVRKLPMDEALGMIRSGEITDVITIAALLRLTTL